MPNSRSSAKQNRKNEKRRLENRRVKRTVRTLVRTFKESLELPEASAATSEEQLRVAISNLDKAAKKHIFHKNAAARHKSRLQAKLNAFKAKGAAKA